MQIDAASYLSASSASRVWSYLLYFYLFIFLSFYLFIVFGDALSLYARYPGEWSQTNQTSFSSFNKSDSELGIAVLHFSEGAHLSKRDSCSSARKTKPPSS
jgi:hypothetical protein